MNKKILKAIMATTSALGIGACSSVESPKADIIEEEQVPEKEEEVTETKEENTEDNYIVAYDEENIKIFIKHLDYDGGVFGPELKIFIENNSDEDLCFQVENMDINGFVIDPIFSEDIPAHKKINSGISIFDSELEENNIDKIEEITISFRIFNWETIENTITTEPFSFVVLN